MVPWWIPVVTVAISIISAISICFYYFGKLEQKVNDSELRMSAAGSAIDRTFARHEENQRELYALGRKHEDDDKKHFGDTDVHWNKREREWLGVRFETLEERLNSIEKRFDSQDISLRELLRRSEK